MEHMELMEYMVGNIFKVKNGKEVFLRRKIILQCNNMLQ